MHVIILFLLILFVSCDQYELSSPTLDAPFIATAWKLEAVVSSDTIKTIGVDNEKSYLLLFEPDGNAYGFSYNNHLWGKYTLNEQQKSIHAKFYPMTYALEPPEGELFLDRLSKVHVYVLSGDVLRLHFSENGYLQFRATEDDGSFKRIFSDTSEMASLTGTAWKLEGFSSRGGEPDMLKPVSPKNYQLLFEPGGDAYGKSSTNHLRGKHTLDEEKKTIRVDMQTMTKVNETPDGKLYLDRLSKVYRYELADNVLRLYYSKAEYLQYRPAATSTSSLDEIPRFLARTEGNKK